MRELDLFLYIRTKDCHRPVSVSPLRIETSEERRLFALGEKNYNAKKELAKIALRKQTPNDEESDMIHAMWLKHLEYRGMFYISFKSSMV